jgi:predicted RNase H-like nuclease (RuvC/YqgF family)
MLGFLLGFIPACASAYTTATQTADKMQHASVVEQLKLNRKDLDGTLQRMKDLRKRLIEEGIDSVPKSDVDKGEVIAQHTLAIRDLESAIMREGMTLKTLNTENPYPHSYDPKSPVIDPTADGLKL